VVLGQLHKRGAYTGVRVAELVAIRLTDADLDACRIRITNGKSGKEALGHTIRTNQLFQLLEPRAGHICGRPQKSRLSR
jgi:integrase